MQPMEFSLRAISGDGRVKLQGFWVKLSKSPAFPEIRPEYCGLIGVTKFD